MKDFNIRILVMCFLFALSCEKKEEFNNNLTNGIWEEKYYLEYDNENNIVDEDSIDLLINFHEQTMQQMFNGHDGIYFVMYLTYEYENGKLTTIPDSLLDNQGYSYLWNSIDSFFQEYPVKESPKITKLEFISKNDIKWTHEFNTKQEYFFDRNNEQIEDLRIKFNVK